jgi:hypothetical protein
MNRAIYTLLIYPILVISAAAAHAQAVQIDHDAIRATRIVTAIKIAE